MKQSYKMLMGGFGALALIGMTGAAMAWAFEKGQALGERL